MAEVRVVTFNNAGAVDSDKRFYRRRGSRATAARAARARGALDELARFARDQAIDVLALQEVDICHAGAHTLHQCEYLAGALAMERVFLPGFDYDLAGLVTVTTGVATLSRPVIARSAEIRFPQTQHSARTRLKNAILGAKKALHCSVALGDVELHIVNAHLTHDNHRQKEMELATLIAYCSALDPCLLVGDLNTTPPGTRSPTMREPALFEGDRCMELLVRHRERFQCDPRVFDHDRVIEVCTYPSSGPDLKLDYALLFSRGRRATLARERVGPAVARSNHLPVTVTVELAGG